jgi:hypothetical protein
VQTTTLLNFQLPALPNVSLTQALVQLTLAPGSQDPTLFTNAVVAFIVSNTAWNESAVLYSDFQTMSIVNGATALAIVAASPSPTTTVAITLPVSLFNSSTLSTPQSLSIALQLSALPSQTIIASFISKQGGSAGVAPQLVLSYVPAGNNNNNTFFFFNLKLKINHKNHSTNFSLNSNSSK